MFKSPVLLRPSWRWFSPLVVVAAALASASAPASERRDHERARAAVQAGEVMRLDAVMERLQRSHPGQVLEIELDQEEGRWIYEVRLLQADGQLLKLALDARTAEVLNVRRKHRLAGQRDRGEWPMRVLLVEDDPHLRAQLRVSLEDADYVIDEADNGRDAQHLGETEPFDAVILDLGLPQIDGLSVLRHWREAGHTLPVLILTARDSWHEKVAGIDAGADDYLAKPFHTEELLARLRALIRRSQGLASSMLKLGALTLDTRSSRVALDGQPIALTSHEYRLLAYLMHRPQQVVTRTELTEHLYNQDFDRDSNTIEVFVGRLRKKLPPDVIETVRGLGYRLVAPQ